MKTLSFAGYTSEEVDELSEALEAVPGSVEIQSAVLVDKDGRESSVKFYDDGGPCWDKYKWFVCGFEFGPTMLVRADSDSSAYEIWVDESPTIEAGDVHEAYGAFDRLLEAMEVLGHVNDYALRDFCSRWDEWYFEVSTRGPDAWDNWELLEGYRMQSNSSGTGIVDMGHYEWMRPLESSGYTALFSGVVA